MPPFRFVVIHQPGPSWRPDVLAFEQPGLQAHMEHFATLLKAGKLELGGPFLDEGSGGMMIPEVSVSEEEIRSFAAENLTVKPGLLTFEIRQWTPALSK